MLDKNIKISPVIQENIRGSLKYQTIPQMDRPVSSDMQKPKVTPISVKNTKKDAKKLSDRF